MFEDDKEIQNFITLTSKFDGLTIDDNNVLLEGTTLTQESPQSQVVTPKEMTHDDIAVPAKCVEGCKTQGVVLPKLQWTDG